MPRQLPSGKWQARWVDHTGRERSKALTTEAQAKAMERRGAIERDDVHSGRVRPQSAITVAAAAAEWLQSRPKARRRDNDSHLRLHILPHLGKLKVSQVDDRAIEKFIRALEETRTSRPGEKNVDGRKLSPNSIANVLTTLSKMLGDNGHRVRARIKVPTSGHGWIKDPAHVVRFLAACNSKRSPWFHTAACLAVFAGLRKGEVAGLLQDAVDIEQGLLRIDRSYTGPVKSKHLRWVPLAPELGAILKAWMAVHPGKLVVTVGSKPITEKTGLAGRVRRACRRAGVDEVTFHQLRHTAASHLAQRVPLPMIGAVLGHADPKTTARYAHLDPRGMAHDPRMHLSFATPGDTPPPTATRNMDGTGGAADCPPPKNDSDDG